MEIVTYRSSMTTFRSLEHGALQNSCKLSNSSRRLFSLWMVYLFDVTATDQEDGLIVASCLLEVVMLLISHFMVPARRCRNFVPDGALLTSDHVNHVSNFFPGYANKERSTR